MGCARISVCDAGSLAQSVGQADINLMNIIDEAILIGDRELVHSFFPSAACTSPVSGYVSQGQR
jgi:hypothetical protein